MIATTVFIRKRSRLTLETTCICSDLNRCNSGILATRPHPMSTYTVQIRRLDVAFRPHESASPRLGAYYPLTAHLLISIPAFLRPRLTFCYIFRSAFQSSESSVLQFQGFAVIRKVFFSQRQLRRSPASASDYESDDLELQHTHRMDDQNTENTSTSTYVKSHQDSGARTSASNGNGNHEMNIEPSVTKVENDDSFQAGGPVNGVSSLQTSHRADGPRNLNVSDVFH